MANALARYVYSYLSYLRERRGLAVVAPVLWDVGETAAAARGANSATEESSRSESCVFLADCTFLVGCMAFGRGSKAGEIESTRERG